MQVVIVFFFSTPDSIWSTFETSFCAIELDENETE